MSELGLIFKMLQSADLILASYVTAQDIFLGAMVSRFKLLPYGRPLGMICCLQETPAAWPMGGRGGRRFAVGFRDLGVGVR